MATVAPLRASDYDRWAELWRGYLTFYETEVPAEIYAHTWARILDPNGAIYALGVRDENGRLVGITHYLFHAHAWTTTESCYLQDLFVEDCQRGKGYARALIEGVAAETRKRGLSRLYWTTHNTNATARRLYDRIANNAGFIRYEYPL
jgi:GNAT superfamily N-acetyltransferase